MGTDDAVHGYNHLKVRTELRIFTNFTILFSFDTLKSLMLAGGGLLWRS